MYKRCELILKELESKGKIKVWWDFKFPEKEPLKLRLKDMLEEQVDEKYYLSDMQVNKIQTSNFMQEKKRIQEKEYSDTILAKDWKDSKCVQVGQLYGTKIEPNPQAGRIYDSEGISPTMDSCSGGNRMPKIAIKNATKKGYDEAVEGDSINLSYPDSNTRRGRVGHQVSQTIQCNDMIGVGVVNNNGLRIRKLTPKECWRLMGFDDDDFKKAEKVNSNTQLYKQARKLDCSQCFRKNI